MSLILTHLPHPCLFIILSFHCSLSLYLSILSEELSSTLSQALQTLPLAGTELALSGSLSNSKNNPTAKGERVASSSSSRCMQKTLVWEAGARSLSCRASAQGMWVSVPNACQMWTVWNAFTLCCVTRRVLLAATNPASSPSTVCHVYLLAVQATIKAGFFCSCAYFTFLGPSLMVILSYGSVLHCVSAAPPGVQCAVLCQTKYQSGHRCMQPQSLFIMCP